MCRIYSGDLLRKLSMFWCGPGFTHLIQYRKRNEHKLITTGPYAIVRHPGYTGWALWAISSQGKSWIIQSFPLSGHFSNRISNSFIFPISRYFSGPVQSNFIYTLQSGNIQIFRRPYTRRRKPFVSFLWRSVCWIQTSRAQVGYSICRWSCRESMVI